MSVDSTYGVDEFLGDVVIQPRGLLAGSLLIMPQEFRQEDFKDSVVPQEPLS